MTTTSTHTEPQLAELPARTVLAIDGEGAPSTPAFQAAVAALEGDVPLEGTWYSFSDADGWRWTMSAPVPAGARVEQRPAERVARLVHHGPYEDEERSLAALYAFVAEQGFEPAGAHRELYLTDPSAVAPADLRTELSVPVR
jgi:hypothetical protein